MSEQTTHDTFSVYYLAGDGKRVYAHAYRSLANARARAVTLQSEGHSVEVVANYSIGDGRVRRIVVSSYSPSFPRETGR